MINWLRLGSKIQDMRRLTQITQQQLAERSKISDVYLGYIEQGIRRCSIETYIRLVNALGFTLDDLFADYLTHRKGIMLKTMRELLDEFSEVLIKLTKKQKETSSHSYSTAQKGK